MTGFQNHSLLAAASLPLTAPRTNQHELQTLEIINLLVVIGIFSCVSVIYKNSSKNTQKMDEIVDLLRKIADKS